MKGGAHVIIDIRSEKHFYPIIALCFRDIGYYTGGPVNTCLNHVESLEYEARELI